MDRVNRIRKDHTDRVLQKREAVDRAETELAAVFDAPKIDWPNKARPAIDALALARGELTKEMSIMMLRMRAVLTLDQWKMLEARLQNPPERGGKGRGRGYRGPGEPGSGPGYNERKQ
jgi:Spy/CpxP family protein refolding chaperone